MNTTVVAVQTSRPVERSSSVSSDRPSSGAGSAPAAVPAAPPAAASADPQPSPGTRPLAALAVSQPALLTDPSRVLRAAAADATAGAQETGELQRLRQAHALLQEAHESQTLRHAAQVRQHKSELGRRERESQHKDAEILLLKESQVELQRMLLNQVQTADDGDSTPTPRELELEEANRALKATLENLGSHLEALQEEHTSLEEELAKATNSVHDDEMVEQLLAEKDSTIDQLQQALAQSEADVVAAEEAQQEAREEVSVLTEALSTVQDQLNLLRGRWKQYRDDVENEVAMLDCHIENVCSASGLPEDADCGFGETGVDAPAPAAMTGVTPEKLSRFSSAGASAMRSTAAISGSPPVMNSPGFFEEGSVADSSMASSTAGEMDGLDGIDVRYATEEEEEEEAEAAETQLPDVAAQRLTTAETDGEEPQTGREEKKLGLLSLRDRVKAVQSELGAQHGTEQQELLQLEGIIRSAEGRPPPPELHDPAELTIGSSFATNTTAGTNDSAINSLDRPADLETSMRTTTAQMDDDDIPALSSLQDAASPSSPAQVGRASVAEHEPAGTPPDESVGFTMAAEALRAEMEASMATASHQFTTAASSDRLRSSARGAPVAAQHDTPVSAPAKDQQAQMAADVVRLAPKSLQALERARARRDQASAHALLEKEKREDAEVDDVGDEAKVPQSDFGSSVEEQLTQSQREKEAMVAEVADMKQKYAKMKLKYKNQASVQASVNQALLALESEAMSQWKDDGTAFSDVSSINSEQEQTLQHIGLVHRWHRNHVDDGARTRHT